jgi:DNA-binding response OmpR family regulator
MNILLVEDTFEIGESIQLYLQACGFEVQRATTIAQWEHMLAQHAIDAAIVDRMLPDGAWIQLCQTIKSLHPNVPVLLETAKFQIEDKLKGFDAGADDYLVKPYDLRELEVRLKKLLDIKKQLDLYGDVQTLTVGDLFIDIENMNISRWNEEVHCTSHEWIIIKLLCEVPGKVISRSELAEFIRGDEGQRQSDNKLDVLISWLRKKLGKDTFETVKGVGYRVRS